MAVPLWMKSQRISFIIVWNITGEFVMLHHGSTQGNRVIFSNPDISNINGHLRAGRDGTLTARTPYSFTLPTIHFASCNQFHVHMYISHWGPGEQSPSLEIIFDSYESCAPHLAPLTRLAPTRRRRWKLVSQRIH